MCHSWCWSSPTLHNVFITLYSLFSPSFPPSSLSFTPWLRFAHQIHRALGFDWLMLFLHSNIHKETVNRALRILVQLLSDATLLQKFHEGDIFGGWVHGFETISPEMSHLLETSTTNFNPFKPSMHKPLPGAAVLSVLLPNHSQSAQVFLLMVAILLGRTCTDIPFSANFDLEALDLIFQVGSSSRMEQAKICPDAAYVLLAMARALVHQVINIQLKFSLEQP